MASRRADHGELDLPLLSAASRATTMPRPGEYVPKDEPLSTIKAAAYSLNLPTWKLRRAVKLGLVPSYALLNSRRLVRISEVVAALTRMGGDGP